MYLSFVVNINILYFFFKTEFVPPPPSSFSLLLSSFFFSSLDVCNSRGPYVPALCMSPPSKLISAHALSNFAQCGAAAETAKDRAVADIPPL
jgi:hypothetical protein